MASIVKAFLGFFAGISKSETSMETTTTFWYGMGLSALVSGIVTCLCLLLIEAILPSADYHGIGWVGGIGAFLIFGFGTYALTEWGKFQIDLGKKGLREWLGSPTGEQYGPGIGWTIPLLSSVKEVDTQAGLTSLGMRDYTIKNGFEVKIDAELTWRVEDTIAYQAMKPDEVKRFVETQFEGAIRKVMIELEVNMSHADIDKLNQGKDEALKVSEAIALFKGAAKNIGPKQILNILNGLKADGRDDPGETAWLARFGIEPIQVQIKDAAFSKEIEQTVERILKEIFDRPGMTADADNKAAVISILRKAMEDTGFKFSDLSPSERAEYASRLVDTSLALEDKAKVTRINFGGRAPKGTIFNPNGP